MYRTIHRHSVSLGLLAAFASSASAQVCGPAYRVQPTVVMEEQLEQRMRVVYETVYEDKEVRSTRYVPKTRTETRSYKVTKPVVETSTVEERYTVLKPVKTREWVDRSYDETTYVTETAEREEAYTTYRPVTETTYQPRDYVVQRPVTETQYQTRQYTTYQPVTTYERAVVDQGQYVAQQYYQPGDTRYGLKFVPGGYTVNPNGVGAYRRGGLGWVPYTSQGNTFAQMQYQPNPVEVAVPRTSLMPQIQQQQVPVTTTRMESQVVQEQVPVTTTRMEAIQQTRRVPYTTQRPVTRRVENMVPVDKVEWVEQEMVRPKTVERTSYKVETVERDVEVRYYETEEVVNVVKVPRRVARYEPYIVRKTVPRVVNSPVVLSYQDPYAIPMAMGQTSWMPAVSDSTLSTSPSRSSEKVTYGEGRPVDESISPSDDPADVAPSLDDSSSQRLKKVETVDPEQDAESEPGDAPSAESANEGGLDLTPSNKDAGGPTA